MNYYGPREITRDDKPTGLFHYTCRNDGRIWPIGPCADGCPGHKTAEEACEHYREFLLAGIVLCKIEQEWPKDKCDVDGCNEAATHYGYSRNEPGAWERGRFCDVHATAEEMAKKIEVGECTSSY